MRCSFEIGHEFRKTSFHFLQLRPARLDYREFMSGRRHEFGRLPRSTADLDRGDAVQNVGVEIGAGVRLNVDDASVDLDHHLYLLKIIRIDTNINDAAYRNAVVLDLRTFVESCY